MKPAQVWPILEGCEAHLHNSLGAARGRIYAMVNGKKKITKVPRCICPGSEAARIADNRARRERAAYTRKEKLTRGNLAGGDRATARPGAWIPQGVKIPDFTNAACRSPYGMRAMDAALGGPAGPAKALCDICPIRVTKCRPYVLAAESPAGSWGGVWAGMTPKERKNVK